MEIGATEAKARLLELIRLANSGDDIVITYRGEPVVRLVPYKPTPDAKTPGVDPTER